MAKIKRFIHISFCTPHIFTRPSAKIQLTKADKDIFVQPVPGVLWKKYIYQTLANKLNGHYRYFEATANNSSTGKRR